MDKIGLSIEELQGLVSECLENTLYDENFMRRARQHPSGKQMSDMEIGLVALSGAVAATIHKNNEKVLADLRQAGLIGS